MFGRSLHILRDLRLNKIPIFEREGWQSQPSLSKIGILFSCKSLRTEDQTKSKACFLKARHSRAFKKQALDFI